MRSAALVALFLAACGEDGPPAPPPSGTPDPRVEELALQLADEDGQVRHRACLELGEIGTGAAREALLGVLKAPSPDVHRDGPLRLYAAAGLTRCAHPSTAIALIESLSRVNPNDNIAALASEIVESEYYTVDAQICEALLAMGLWTAEEELCNRMRRKDKVRVLIDAHAILRRHTGLALPYRYNGSYEDRLAQAEAWRAALRKTRSEREAARPFDASDPVFRRECRRVVAWLGGKAVNDRLIAHKVLELVGRHAQPFLEEALAGDRAVLQRQAAYMMGRIGHAGAAPALRRAVALEDADARAEALDALRKVGDSASAGLAVERLGDEDPEVRAAAARYLGAFGGEEHRAVLRASAKDEGLPAAAAAMWIALLRLGDEGAALQPVLECFVEGEQIEREAAQEALEEWAGEELSAGARAPAEERRAAVAAWRSG